MSKRKVLLLEPNYKNKYPPIGLMKLATYHRALGDDVIFYKGDLKQFVLEDICDQCVDKITEIDNSINWNDFRSSLLQYIYLGKQNIKSELIQKSKYSITLDNCFEFYRKQYKNGLFFDNPKWDRICITTLFTFYWEITIETIEFAKKIVKNLDELKIGGVLATLLPDEIEKETGIKPFKGLLDKPGILDDNNIIIDDLPLDYSILEEIEYKYPENNAYYGYMTRGCIRKCSFCAVPKLEPEFKDFVPLKNQVKKASLKFGEKRNLLLLDNNVLASNCFPDIIKEIKASGFTKNSVYIEPNLLDIAVKNLTEGINDHAYIRKSFTLLNELLDKLKGSEQQEIYNLMNKYELLSLNSTKKENIIAIYPDVKDVFEKKRNKSPKKRYVDFNQGVDARLLVKDENLMKLLSEIPINPLRIAFDSMQYEKVYVKAIELAAKHGITRLSNYLLYNEKDKPVELYQRLKINVDLCDKLSVDIYSFPMKFHPINGKEWYNNRNYIGIHWNRKFIRAVQAVLNATKGKIGRGSSFFYRAFGADENEFLKILYMPEPFILYREMFDNNGMTEKWWIDFNSFVGFNLEVLKRFIEKNDFKNIDSIEYITKPMKVFLNKYYTITREEITWNT